MKEIIELFLVFAKVGLFTFGGGYTMLPILQREVVEKRGWLTTLELTDYFALSQCAPGIISVNVATFTGHKNKGFFGSAAATIGVVLPSVIVITIIAAFITNFSDIGVVKNAFAAIRICVCVLILNTVINLWKSAIKGKIAYIIFFLVLILSIFTDISTMFIVIGAGIAGILISSLRKGDTK